MEKNLKRFVAKLQILQVISIYWHRFFGTTKGRDMQRCFGSGKEFYAKYHDEEWGIPVHEDHLLFEMLLLEGAQAGLTWESILKRREGYRSAFCQFDPILVAEMSDEQLERLCVNSEIIRNRRKIFGARQNAQVFLRIQKEFGSFDKYLWRFVGGKPIHNRWKKIQEAPTSTDESEALAKDLKKRGMVFVGPTIMYAFMQAVGMVNDHTVDCWRFSKQ